MEAGVFSRSQFFGGHSMGDGMAVAGLQAGLLGPPKEQTKMLANENMVPSGNTPSGNILSPIEEQAFELTRCALMLDQARANREQCPDELVMALNQNLELWVAIRTVAMRPDSGMTDQIRTNLRTLAAFVAQKTFASAEGLPEETLDTLIKINLQISEGLLEGLKRTEEDA